MNCIALLKWITNNECIAYECTPPGHTKRMVAFFSLISLGKGKVSLNAWERLNSIELLILLGGLQQAEMRFPMETYFNRCSTTTLEEKNTLTYKLLNTLLLRVAINHQPNRAHKPRHVRRILDRWGAAGRRTLTRA